MMRLQTYNTQSKTNAPASSTLFVIVDGASEHTRNTNTFGFQTRLMTYRKTQYMKKKKEKWKRGTGSPRRRNGAQTKSRDFDRREYLYKLLIGFFYCFKKFRMPKRAVGIPGIQLIERQRSITFT